MRFFLWAGALLVVTALVATAYFWKPHATLRVTTGPLGTNAQKFMSAFATVVAAEHPRIRFQPVQVDGLKASAKAVEDGKVDLAVVRSDVTPPTNGQTIAILRRDAIVFVLPPKSPIDSISKLSGKTVAIPQSRVQDLNSEALDTILAYYDVTPKSVQRLFLAPDEMIGAIRGKHVAAVFAIGPIGPGEAVDAVLATAKATSGTPTMLAFDDADAFNKRFPAFESFDVPEGALRARPATPDDTVTTLAITYRLIAPDSMLNLVAGAIGQSIFTNKAKLISLTPLASQIEAPDPDDKNPALPVHPGVANYLNSGEQSFFDEFQEYFYIGGMALSILGSVATLMIGRVRRARSKQDQKKIARLIGIAELAQRADEAELGGLEAELHRIISTTVMAETSAEETSLVSLAIEHARHVIVTRRASLRAGAKVAPASAGIGG
jgi:TRAP-type uncharacterized transport system substrate-binding protein